MIQPKIFIISAILVVVSLVAFLIYNPTTLPPVLSPQVTVIEQLPSSSWKVEPNQGRNKC